MGLLGRTVIVAAAAALFAACGPSEPVVVSSADFGDAWPFHAEEATLFCEGPQAIWAEIDGQHYPLNALAHGWVKERHPDITLIPLETAWRDQPDNPGAKSDLGPVMDVALAICDG